MRRIAQVVFVSGVCGGLLCGGARAQAAREGTARVLYSDSALRGPDTVVTGRRDFDVDVVRTQMPQGPTLWFLLYRTENGRLERFYPFAAVERAAFETASFAWADDTTVVITLRDANGSRVAGFRITGYRGSGNIQRLP